MPRLAAFAPHPVCDRVLVLAQATLYLLCTSGRRPRVRPTAGGRGLHVLGGPYTDEQAPLEVVVGHRLMHAQQVESVKYFASCGVWKLVWALEVAQPAVAVPLDD